MKKFSKFLVPMLAAGMLAACSDDKFDGPAENTDNSNVDRVQYLNIAISSPSTMGGRANEANDMAFADGTDESNIQEVYFVFYDKDGRRTGAPVELSGYDFKSDNTPNYVEKRYTGQVKIELERGQGEPAYVMCYINPLEKSDLSKANLGEIKNITREEPWKNSNDVKLFGMSNSVYYGSDPHKTDATNTLIRATPIKATQLFNTNAEADAALSEENPEYVDIYVERYAAKIALDIKKTGEAYNINDVELNKENEKPYKLKFTPVKWAMNAREKEFFVSKSYTATSAGEGVGPMGTENATYATVEGVLNPTSDPFATTVNWTWNEANKFRSYWGRSVSYYNMKFPDVADDIKNENDYTLVYQKYNDLTTKGWDLGTTQYVRENTIGKNGLNAATNTMAALASTIVVGKYTLSKDMHEYGDDVTFYVKDEKIYFDPSFSGIQQGDVDIITGLLAGNHVLSVKTGDNIYTPIQQIEGINLSNYFEVYHPESTDTKKVNEWHVTLKVKSNFGTVPVSNGSATTNCDIYFFKDGYHKLDASNLDVANEELRTNAGYASKYNQGMAFFSIPVKHLGFYRDDNPNLNTASFNDMQWDKVRVGDFGIVRNHAYNINIESISGLGTGIADPTNPIVPEKSRVSYTVNYRINILSWRIVPTQNVKL